MPATGYLRQHGDRLFGLLDADRRALLSAQLKRVQRVFQLSQTPEQMPLLIAQKLESAHQVVRWSQEHFVQQFADRLGGADAAAAVHSKARYIHGTLLNLYIDMRKAFPAPPPSFRLPDVMTTTSASVHIPSLDELFGSDDLCICEDCLSVLSPAAYFVDLLQYIDLPIPGQSTTSLDALLKRRPDLAHIQLTCDNANTRIPYVDLVNEILASYVAHDAPFPYNDPKDGVTSGTAEELRVNPIALTDAAAQAEATAHDSLLATVFPFTLPYHHWLEIVRLYLGHFGLRRESLMRRFQADDDFGTEMAIAAETLRLSPQDFEVVTIADFDGAGSTIAPVLENLFGFVETAPPSTSPPNHVAPEITGANDPRREQIKALQNFLKNISTSPGLTPAIRAAMPVNGVFDANTVAAVQAFRGDHGLPKAGGTDSGFWAALAGEGHPALSIMMSHVPMFMRQTQVGFDDLVAIVESRFFNPQFNERVFFSELGITPEELMAFVQSGAATLPPAMLAKVIAGGSTAAAFIKRASAYHDVPVLDSPPGALCDLDQTTIRHIDGTLLTSAELLTLQQSIRLWRKLGWSLHEVDLVLSAYPLSDPFTLVLRLADMKGLLDALRITVDQLMTFWGRIDTWNGDSLYERLFRSKTAQSLDPIFALDDLRREIDDFVKAATPPQLKDHAPLLLAALRIDAAGLARLVALLPNGDLSLANVSALHRQATLSRALELSLADLLALQTLCGIDPFEVPAGQLESTATAFVRFARAVQASTFTITQIDYLVRHQVTDGDGQMLTPDRRRDLVGTLRADLDDIQRAYVAADDPIGDTLVRQLGAALLPAVAETLARMVYGSIVYAQPLADFIDGVAYPAAVAAKIRYDADRQALIFSGVMTPAEQSMLTAAAFVNTLPLPLRVPFSEAVDAIFDAPDAFAREKLFDLMPAGAIVSLLRSQSSLGPDGAPDLTAIGIKVGVVLADVRRFLSTSTVKRTIASTLAMEGAVVSALLEDAAVLAAVNVAGAPAAIEDFFVLQGAGLDAAYFANTTLAGAPVVQQVEGGIAYDGTTPLPAGVGPGAFSARWTGFVHAPLTEDFSFVIRARDGIRVIVDGVTLLDEFKAQPVTDYTLPITLRKGSLNEIVIEHAHFSGSVVLEWQWRSPSIELAPVPQDALYDAATLATLVRPLERIEKIAAVVKGFELTAPEVNGLSRLAMVDWNDTPMAPPPPASVPALFGAWTALRAFAAARDGISKREGAFVDVLMADSLDTALDRFADVTGADRADLQQFADACTRHPFNATTLAYDAVLPDIADVTWWTGLRDSCMALDRSGCSAAQLIDWGRVKDVTRAAPAPPMTNWYAMSSAPAARARARATGEDLKRLVKARYDEATWRLVARPLNDSIRELDRDALIGAVMAMPAILQAHMQSSDELFEFFLIEPKMDACMETARIPQGIATVLLFIQRGFMGLMEGDTPPVKPSHFDRQLFERMQSYAIWQPSREILIHTERYIRWDLLDRKSDAYLGFEHDLRKQDLTQVDSPTEPRGQWAETAFMNFLERVDEVSKLEICAQYHDEAEHVLHVFARTQNTPYRFFYRRADQFEGVGIRTGTWTAWEPFPVDIDYIQSDDAPGPFASGGWSGVHLMPIKWNRRLYLMWPRFRLVPDDDYNRDTPHEFDRQNCWEIKLAWTELWNGAWSPKQVSAASVMSRPYVAPPVPSPPKPPAVPTRVETQHKARLVWNFDLLRIPPVYQEWEYWDENVEGVAHNELVPGDGLVIKNLGDYAWFQSETKVTSAMSWLPDPCAHYFDLRIADDKLRVDVAVRYHLQNTLAGKMRSQEHVSFTVVQDNKLTYRERTHDVVESPLYLSRYYNGGLGGFLLGTCKVRDIETYSQETPENYYLFRTPSWSGNFYQSCRHVDPLATHFAVGTPAQTILDRTLTTFTVQGHQTSQGFSESRPFFFQDRDRVYLVTPTHGKTRFNLATANAKAAPVLAPGNSGLSKVVNIDFTFLEPDYQFQMHCHPQVCGFIQTLNRDGLMPLLAAATQQRKDTTPPYFKTAYQPTWVVAQPYPDEAVDFSYGGAYSQYNWELFLYAPMRTWFELKKSYQLSAAGVFLKTVADLVSTDDKTPLPDRIWQFAPFRKGDAVRIQETLGLLMYTGSDPALLKKKAEVQATILDWLSDPFNPHLIARRRTSAYMQAVMMDCCRHHLAAADIEFTRYTIESIPKALQSLIIVLKIIGPNRPGPTRTAGKILPETYHTLKTKGHLGAFSQFSLALSDLETELPFTHSVPTLPGSSGSVASIQAMYFCIPPNDEWATMWDTVADRLYKIRHCMNIDGIEQELPLVPTPIDPMLLVEARAMGLDISSVLDDFRVPLPHHEFSVIFERAVRLADDVRSFAQRFEALLEKSESEGLARMRVEQEARWLKDYLRRELVQATQLQAALRESIEKTREATEARFDFYDQQIKRGLLEDEKSQRSELTQAHVWETMSQGAEIQASIVGMVPDVTAGTLSGSTFGGSQLGSAYRAIGGAFRTQGSQNSHLATIAALNAQWERRQDEWSYQRSLAALDLRKVDVDLLSARIQENIAALRLENHDKTTANTEAVLDAYRQRFFTPEQYGAVAEDLYPDYFQLFQLAYQYARQAEACCRFQHGLTDLDKIQFGNWHHASKGMLACEKLSLSLKQLEQVHLDADQREYEIRHDLSLVMLDPIAFIELRQTGECEFEIPERWFDERYPGFYLRRLRGASVTIPCVVGRHAGINCVLTLLSNKTRISSEIATTYEEDVTRKDPRFVTTFAAMQSIATSHGQDDNGMFDAEPRDGRYAPFRGAGVVSRWRVQLPIETNALERSSLTDFMLHVPHTARPGGRRLQDQAWAAREKALKDPDGLPQRRLFRGAFESRDVWHRFLHPDGTTGGQLLTVELSCEAISTFFRERTVSVSEVDLYLMFRRSGDHAVYRSGSGLISVKLSHVVGAVTTGTAIGTFTSIESSTGGTPIASIPLSFDIKPGVASSLAILLPETAIAGIAPSLREPAPGSTHIRLAVDAIEDLFVVVKYALK